MLPEFPRKRHCITRIAVFFFACPVVFTILLTVSRTVLAADNPVAYCVSTSSPPVIDGDLSDPCWKEVEPVDNFVIPVSGQKAKFPTTFKVTYERTHLYIAVTAQENERIDPATRKDNDIVRDRYVSRYSLELFLSPREGTCYQLVWDINGIRWDSDWLDNKWDGNWQVASRVAGDTVTYEVDIELSSMGVSEPEPGTQWGLNLFRNGENTCVGSWSPVSGSYHNPSTFGVLLIGSREAYWQVRGSTLLQRLEMFLDAHGDEIRRHPLLRPLAARTLKDHAAWEKATYPDESSRWNAFRQMDYNVEALEKVLEWNEKLNGGNDER